MKTTKVQGSFVHCVAITDVWYICVTVVNVFSMYV